MPDAKPFFDTNILLYLLSADAAKADRAENLLAGGGTISVQVLNEFAAVASRKLSMSWSEIRDTLSPIRGICQIEPMSIATHDRALEIAERYGFSIYDATIVASARLTPDAKRFTPKTFGTAKLSNNLQFVILFDPNPLATLT